MLTYDVGNNGADSADYKDTYTHDLAGNRLSKLHNAGNDSTTSGTGDETITYDYNDDDQLVGEDSTDNSHDAQYEYDANGSTTLKSTSGGDTTYRYDLRNRLVGVDTNGDGHDEQVYAYDSTGNRIMSGQDTNSDGTVDTHIYYLVDTNNSTGYSQVLEESAGIGDSITSNAYLIGLDVIGQTDSSGALHELFLYDGHGSVRRITDGDGNVTAGTGYDYDAFGNAVGFDPANSPTRLLYRGELELFPKAVDGRDRLSGELFSVDEHDAVDQVLQSLAPV